MLGFLPEFCSARSVMQPGLDRMGNLKRIMVKASGDVTQSG